MKFYDIIIIGAGASGLACAVNAKKDTNSILIIEKNAAAGKKILITGNGRCNLTNEFCVPELFENNPEGLYPFFTDDKSFTNSVITSYSSRDAVNFFEDLGILTTSADGYIYPRSLQAKSVSDILYEKCIWLGVNFAFETEVSSVCRLKPASSLSDKETGNSIKFAVNDSYECNHLVFACGGMAAPKTGSDGSAYKYIESLGHSIIKPLPALCAIKCSDKFFKSIAGARNYSRISLLKEGNTIISSFGNLQFTSYGVSGIPAFQISGTVSEILDADIHADLKIHIDLLPEFSMEEVIDKAFSNPSLTGIINDKLAGLILKLSESEPNDENLDVMLLKYNDGTAGNHNKNKRIQAIKTAFILKNLKVKVSGTMSFNDAQITSGGVSISEINPATMESNIIPGLYFIGEVIDVNGICGGYNLQWAWSTAAICARNLVRDF